MGAILAKFRKEKTTYEILEKLETDIKQIEEYSVATQSRRKRFVGNFLVISIGLYIACFLIFYFVFFPPTWSERLSYSVPLLIFPLIIFFLRRFLAWYFQRKLNNNNKTLNELQAKKKEILEKVMDNETYKVALKLLNRFGDNKTMTRPPAIAPVISLPSAATPNNRINPVKPQAPVTPVSTQRNMNNTGMMTAPAVLRQRQLNTSLTPRMNAPGSPLNNSASVGNVPPPGWRQMQQMRPRTPFPIMNQHGKGFLEKMVDYLIGDGPQNRFAMICKQCYGHNGMALEEEFEYMAFRCVYCNFPNPSKKVRPIAPPLPTIRVPSLSPPSLSTPLTTTRRNSDDDSSTSIDEKVSNQEDSEEESDVKKMEIAEKSETEDCVSSVLDQEEKDNSVDEVKMINESRMDVDESILHDKTDLVESDKKID